MNFFSLQANSSRWGTEKSHMEPSLENKVNDEEVRSMILSILPLRLHSSELVHYRDERALFFARCELGFDSLPHPPYSEDLAHSDYYLIPNLRKWLTGRCFESNEQVEWETEGCFEGFEKSYYLEGIEKLKNHWTCIINLFSIEDVSFRAEFSSFAGSFHLLLSFEENFG